MSRPVSPPSHVRTRVMVNPSLAAQDANINRYRTALRIGDCAPSPGACCLRVVLIKSSRVEYPSPEGSRSLSSDVVSSQKPLEAHPPTRSRDRTDTSGITSSASCMRRCTCIVVHAHACAALQDESSQRSAATPRRGATEEKQRKLFSHKLTEWTFRRFVFG
eukprot:7154797-Prymnesium_polylepis.1